MEKFKPKTIEYNIFADDRGFFAPFLEDIEKINPEIGRIKRVYYVRNPSKGTIRGFHYHEREWKIFVVVKGTAKFVCLKPENLSEKYVFVASERKPLLIVVPPGFANGWMSLEDDTILVSASNLTTRESLKDDKRFDPYQFGDVWTVKGR